MIYITSIITANERSSKKRKRRRRSSVFFTLKITATEQISSGCCVRRHRATVVFVYSGQPDWASFQPSTNKSLRPLNSIGAILWSGHSWTNTDICMYVCTGTFYIYSCLLVSWTNTQEIYILHIPALCKGQACGCPGSCCLQWTSVKMNLNEFSAPQKVRPYSLLTV